ncbi:MAG: S-layer homology domain-containing protein [Clostridia bacterium]|nr:S-layer homology domain-containing protein [Clostridia bacterium]
MKKLIAIFSILLIVMLVSSAFAVSKFPDTVGTKYDAAVEKLTNKKIVDGYDDGTFKPANPVTRAQMCKLIVEGLKLQNVTNVVLTKFPDVDQTKWFYSYVKTASDNAIVVGYPDGTFKPDKSVSYAEVMKMILCAMGKEKTMTDKTWPTGYMTEAQVQGLLKDVTYTDVNSPAPRGEVAIALYNMVVKQENEQAAADAEKKAQEEKAQKEAAEKTPKNFGIVDLVDDDDEDYYVKISGVKKEQLVVSLLGSKTFKLSKLEEYEDRVIGYNDTKKDDEIEIALSYSASDLDSAKVISKVDGNVITYKDNTTFDVSNSTNVSKYKYYTFIKVNCDVDDDDGTITFDKVTKEGQGLDSVKFVKADRIIIDSTNCVFAIFKDIDIDDTIKKGKASSSSSSGSSSDNLFGIVDDITSSSKVDYVYFGKKKYEVSSKSKDFTEGTLAAYTKDDDVVKLVKSYATSMLDGSVNVIVAVDGTKAGDQTVKYADDSKYTDYFTSANEKTYKEYSIVVVDVSEDKNGAVKFDEVTVESKLSDVKFAKGDRTYIDKTNKAFIIFQGLSHNSEYKNGKNIDNQETTKYSISYTWSGTNPGVTTPSKTTVESGASYTIPTSLKLDGYTIKITRGSTSYTAGQKISKVTSDMIFTLSATQNPTQQFTVHYAWKDGNALDGVTLQSDVKVNDGTTYNVVLPSKSGYTFSSSEGSSFKVTMDITVWISWEADEPAEQFTITYVWQDDALSGVNLPGPEKVDAGTKYTVKTFDKDGYDIATSENGKITIESDVEIVVSYSIIQCTIKYEWDGEALSGITLPKTETVDYGTEYTVEKFEDDDYIIATSPKGKITVKKDIEIVVSYEKIEAGSGDNG